VFRKIHNIGISVNATTSSVFVRWLAILASAGALTACGSSGSSDSGGGSGTPPTYTLSGTVSGATAGGLVLVNNGTTLTVSSGATTFAFPTGLATGASYTVEIQGVPAGMACSVSNGTGTIGTADVTNIAVTCTAPPVSLGGTVSGLTAGSLVLADGGQGVTVNAGASSFVFTNPLIPGTAYAVTVQTAPTGLTCSVANGTGTVGTANVNNVVVTCSLQSYTVGGNIAFLTSPGLVLADNGSDQLTVPSGATSFTMPTAVAGTSGYTITVVTQPTGLSCSVQNGTGTIGIGTANITSVAVICSDQDYTLGGTITGLNGSGLVLSAGTDTVTVAANATSFTLPTPVPYGSAYTVGIAAEPAGLTCSVSSGATGTMPASNVNTVAVVCSDKAYALGGSINGLSTAGLALTNGTDTLQVPSSATSFQFVTRVAYTSSYNVTVGAQPAGQTCSVSAGSSTMPAANVTSVVVTCSTNAYTLGGTISGLTSSGLVLTDGIDQVTVAPNALQFSMPTALAFQSPYTVIVRTQPVGQICSVTDGTGTIPAGNVSSVQVSCSQWTWEGGSSNGGASGVYLNGTPVPGARDSQMTWTDSVGNFWMFGGVGVDGYGTSGELDDLWMYNPNTQVWTFVTGSATANTAGTYGTTAGAPPVLGNQPGGRHGGMIWIDSSGQLWLFGGTGIDANNNDLPLNDFWMYNPTSQLWTWEGGSASGGANATSSYGTQGVASLNNFPPPRSGASTWTDSTGRFWMFGGVYIDTTTTPGTPILSYLNDMWVYDPRPATQGWTWMSGTNLYNQKGTSGSPAAPGARFGAISWLDTSGNFMLFGGGGYDLAGTPTPDALADLWSFNPNTSTWTWMNGPNTIAAAGVYGTMGVAATGNWPGARGGSVVWTDSAGQVWLFGGLGYGVAAGATSGTEGLLNDLWTYDRNTAQWTWVNGPEAPNTSSGTYGTLGTGATTNQPGSRAGASGWVDSTGHLWMFGGDGYDSSGNLGDMNDLWKF
jgi:N-acetylneuraminic acid mutarotase